MVLSLGWLRELQALSPAVTGVDELPAARLRSLLVDARTASAQRIAQMGDARRVATLTAAPRSRQTREDPGAAACENDDLAWPHRDGLLDPQTSVRPQQIVTDTAGYTDVMFGC